MNLKADVSLTDSIESKRLFCLLDGLPLAIAQAVAYLQESGAGVEVRTYLHFYEQQRKELMESRDEANAPLQDYPNYSVWTTWTISYKAVRKKNETT
ncbi:hypothetical protein MMC14_006127, partial [Varicellaria rhodocarpa]|nr:hypothetical protein [Varicellaria rhodocarpa]